MRKMMIVALLMWSSTVFSGDKKDLLPKLYGKIKISYGVKEVNTQDAWELKSHASRIGVKGHYPITDGLKVVYKLEWEVDVADKATGSTDNIKSRNQYVGIKGEWGTVLAGRHDTPVKLAQGKFDLFNDLGTDIKTLTASEIRAGNMLAYASPKLADMATIMIAVFPGEEPELGQDGPADIISANVKASKNGFFGSVGILDDDVITLLRGVLYYKTRQFQVGGLFETDEAGDVDGDAFILNAAYTRNHVRYKVQIGSSDIGPKGHGLDHENYQGTDSISVGIDYIFNKKASLFGYYATVDDDGNPESDYAMLETDYLKVGGTFKF